jgi:hypothetical protein
VLGVDEVAQADGGSPASERRVHDGLFGAMPGDEATTLSASGGRSTGQERSRRARGLVGPDDAGRSRARFSTT